MIKYIYVKTLRELSRHISKDDLAVFLHESLKPYNDPIAEITDGLDYAFSGEEGKGGFVLLAEENGSVKGSLVMLKTGMQGYVPPNILLYIAVKPDCRGKGIGGNMMKMAFDKAEGNIKLHVEYDNPAKRLYERMGFESKYAEMRFQR